MIKKTFTAILAAAVAFTSLPFVTYAQDAVTIEPITKGVELKNIKRTTPNGNLNINVATVDLNEPTLHLKVLTSDDGLNKSAPIKTMADSNQTVVAINTDFFSWKNNGVLPEGMIISEGEILTSPSNDPIYATLAQREDKTVFADYFTYHLMVTSGRTNDSSDILFYNKNADDMYLKVFDRNYGKYAPDSYDDSIEVVVENGVVTKVLSNQPPVEIPENGYVLKNSLRYSLFLSQNFQVGDSAVLSYTVSPDVSGITEATGGGTILIKNGQKAPFTHVVSGRQPRTALGIDQTGKILYFVTVDGRQQSSIGMTMDELCNFMLETGSYSAINFDGGGSTQMVAKLMGEENKVVNSPSENRYVAVGLGVYADKASGSFSHLKVTAPSKRIPNGSPIDIWIDAFDEYANRVNISDLAPVYTSDKNGVFEGNIYYPYENGLHTVTVTAGGISGSVSFEVYEEKNTGDIMKPGTDEGFNFGVFGGDPQNNNLFANLIKIKRNTAASAFDLAVFGTNPPSGISVPVLSDSVFKKDQNIFLDIADPETQLENMKEILKSVSADNIFITLGKGITADKLTEFKHALKTRLYGKNIFVISFGAANTVRVDSGIYFLTVSGLPDFDRNDFGTVLSRAEYLRINIGGGTPSCEFIPYFN